MCNFTKITCTSVFLPYMDGIMKAMGTRKMKLRKGQRLRERERERERERNREGVTVSDTE